MSDDQDLTIGGLADLVEAFCATHALDRVDLVAHDTGGAVAQVFAARHPERLRSFVLTNCDCHDNIPPAAFRPTVELRAPGLLAPRRAGLLADLDRARATSCSRWATRTSTSSTPARMLDYLAPVPGRRSAPCAFERMLAGLEPSDVLAAEPALGRARRRRRSSSGARATSSSSCRGRTGSATHIGGATEVVEIPGAKLFWPDERPDDLVPHLRRHWSSVAAHAADATR